MKSPMHTVYANNLNRIKQCMRPIRATLNSHRSSPVRARRRVDRLNERNQVRFLHNGRFGRRRRRGGRRGRSHEGCRRVEFDQHQVLRRPVLDVGIAA